MTELKNEHFEVIDKNKQKARAWPGRLRPRKTTTHNTQRNTLQQSTKQRQHTTHN